MDVAVAVVGPPDDERGEAALESARALGPATFHPAPALPALHVRQSTGRRPPPRPIATEPAPAEPSWDDVASAAARPWVLVLGTDERVTPELRREIQALPDTPERVPAYRVPVRMRFLGGDVRGGRFRAYDEVRLAHRDHARAAFVSRGWSAPAARTGTLTAPLRWLPFTNLEDALARMDGETAVGAQALARHGAHARATDFLIHPPAVLAQELVLRGGLRDGLRGVVLATLVAARELILYAKLWEQRLPEHLRQVPSNPESP